MQFWNQMGNSNSTRAIVCCFFQTHNMQNITTQCSSIHKFIILGLSGPKPVLQLWALRCLDLSVKSHWVTGDSQPDSLTDWSISQLWRQKAANGCSSRVPGHRGTITTSAQACCSLLVPRQRGPGSLSEGADSVHLVPCQTQQLRTHHCLSPTVAAPGMSAGGGWIENSPSKISYFQCPISSQTLPLSHLELWDCIFFARITAVCKQDQFQQPLLGREIKFCFNFKSVPTELPPQIPRVRLHFSLQPALHGMEYTWQTF